MARSTLKILAIAAIVGVLGFKLLQQGGSESRFQTMPGHVADFTAVNIDGGKSTYLEMKGTPTLIVLSASWCPACMAEIPMLKKIHEEFRGTSFRILMVNEDDNVKIAAKFKKKYELPWTMVHWNYDLMNKLGNPGVLPVSYLVNAQDSIVKIQTGIFDEYEMRSSIKKLLK